MAILQYRRHQHRLTYAITYEYALNIHDIYICHTYTYVIYIYKYTCIEYSPKSFSNETALDKFMPFSDTTYYRINTGTLQTSKTNFYKRISAPSLVDCVQMCYADPNFCFTVLYQEGMSPFPGTYGVLQKSEECDIQFHIPTL